MFEPCLKVENYLPLLEQIAETKKRYNYACSALFFLQKYFGVQFFVD